MGVTSQGLLRVPLFLCVAEHTAGAAFRLPQVQLTPFFCQLPIRCHQSEVMYHSLSSGSMLKVFASVMWLISRDRSHLLYTGGLCSFFCYLGSVPNKCIPCIGANVQKALDNKWFGKVFVDFQRTCRKKHLRLFGVCACELSGDVATRWNRSIIFGFVHKASAYM